MLKFSDRYTKIVIIMAIILFINIIITSLILTNLLALETPEITMKVDVIEVSEENIIIESTLFISNPNSFTTELSNFQLVTTTDSGYKIGDMDIPNTILPSKDSINISSNTTFKLNGEQFNTLYSRITGKLRVSILGFIKKDLPVKVNILTNPATLIEAIALPQIAAYIDTYDLTNTGLEIEGSVDIINSNAIGFTLDNPTLSFSDSNGNSYGNISIGTLSIPANQVVSHPFIGTISYDVFNKGTLIIRLAGTTKGILGGFVKEMPYNTSASLQIPDFRTVLLYEQNFSITLIADADFTLSGVSAELGVIYKNPTDIPFKAYNLTMSVYRLYDSEKTLLAQDTIDEQQFQPHSETTLSKIFNLTYLEFLPDFTKGKTKWLEVFLYGEFSIGETNQRIPVTIKGLISPSIIGKD